MSDPMFFYRCSSCGMELTDAMNPWLEVQGWERKRVKGGTNHVALRKQTGKMMCHGCMSKLQAGLSPGQLALG